MAVVAVAASFAMAVLLLVSAAVVAMLLYLEATLAFATAVLLAAAPF